MSRNKIGLLLAAAAAYGIYKYSKMTPEQKNDLKEKGKSLLDKGLGGLNLFTKKQTAVNGSGY